MAAMSHGRNNRFFFLWEKFFFLMQNIFTVPACNMAAVQNLYAEHLTGCGGADQNKSPNSAPSASLGHFST